MTTGRGSSSTAWISTLLRPLWTRTAGLMVLLLLPASAERISWGSLPGQEHVNSLGQPLNSGFQFELGGFARGFLPSAQNTQEWAAHWIPVQRTRFNPRTRWFTSVVTVPATASPLQPGDLVYVWGFGGSESSGEWILFRSDRWVWPKANPANPVPLQWFAKDANQVVLGSIRLTGGQLRLATAPVTGSLPPVTTWTQWRSEELGHGHRTAPAEDIDQDGQANIVDFVLGRDPAGAQARRTDPMAAAVAPDPVGTGVPRGAGATAPRSSRPLAHRGVRGLHDVASGLDGLRGGGRGAGGVRGPADDPNLLPDLSTVPPGGPRARSVMCAAGKA